jgi:hypothetical protein
MAWRGGKKQKNKQYHTVGSWTENKQTINDRHPATTGGSDYTCICMTSYYRDKQECKLCNLFTLK